MWRLIAKVENKIKKTISPLFRISLFPHYHFTLFVLSLSSIPLCQPQQMKPAPPPSAHCLSALSQLAPKNRDAQRFSQMNLTPHDEPSTDEPRYPAPLSDETLPPKRTQPGEGETNRLGLHYPRFTFKCSHLQALERTSPLGLKLREEGKWAVCIQRPLSTKPTEEVDGVGRGSRRNRRRRLTAATAGRRRQLQQ